MATASPLTTPPASASGELHADWLEVIALDNPRHAASAEDLIGALRATGSVDALAEEGLSDDEKDIGAATDQGSERAQIVADNAVDLVQERAGSVLRPAHYPFITRGRSLTARANAAKTTYAYLLLLSQYGDKAGPAAVNGASLFEEVAAVAVENYLGGAKTGATSYQFGFPRRRTPRQFTVALDDLCVKLSEGGGHKKQPENRNAKDARLDIAAWLPMPDARPGKVIAFGQCATGGNWAEKLTELHADHWCTKWMREFPPVVPLRCFFVPHRLSVEDWYHNAIDAGIIFDRCRLAAYASQLPEPLKGRVAAWSAHVLQTAVVA